MASIFDILQNTDFTSILNTIGTQARGAASDIKNATPGGLGGLLGAGALGTILGNIMPGNAAKGIALAGLSAVAYNFYKKWTEGQNAAEPEQGFSHNQPRQSKNQFGPGFDSNSGSTAATLDPTAELIVRAMNYAARADGNIDAIERQRMREILKTILPGQNVDKAIDSVSNETIDPSRIADGVISADQAEDVYRLSCATIDPDQFMETSYLEALAKALGISSNRKKELDSEAAAARQHLMNSLPA